MSMQAIREQFDAFLNAATTLMQVHVDNPQEAVDPIVYQRMQTGLLIAIAPELRELDNSLKEARPKRRS